MNSIKQEPWDGKMNHIKQEPWDGKMNSIKQDSWDGKMNPIKQEPWDSKVNPIKQEPWDGKMNPVKQEPWDGSSEFQDYQWDSRSQSQHFSQEIPSAQIRVELEDDLLSYSSSGPPSSAVKESKKRGRPKKPKDESGGLEADSKPTEKKVKQDVATDQPTMTKKRKDRFNGMAEEEVLQRLLPDHLAPNLDILIIGINPGLFAAYVGHHYAGPGNHFWRCMFLSGLIPEPMNAYDDYKLLKNGIGFTNICARTTRGSADLKKQEIKDGAEILRKKLIMYKPRIAAFNGKGIYEIFSGNKNFNIGKQPDKIEGSDTVLFVMPSSSARCAQLPRAADKVPYYLGLKKLRDHLRGDLPVLDESEVIFPAIEPKPKSEVKDEGSDEDEDSRLSCGDSSAKEMTLEQIQNQAEYLEALIASAEGKDISLENCRRRKLKFMPVNRGDYNIDTETSGSGDEVVAQLAPHLHQLKPRSSHPVSGLAQPVPQLDIKQEVPYDSSEYDSLASIGPVALKVSMDDAAADPYNDHLSAQPQYLSLGDPPRKKDSSTSIASSILSHLTQHQAQHSFSGPSQASFTRIRAPNFSDTTKVHGENSSYFPQQNSHKSVKSNKETKSSRFFNI